MFISPVGNKDSILENTGDSQGTPSICHLSSPERIEDIEMVDSPTNANGYSNLEEKSWK